MKEFLQVDALVLIVWDFLSCPKDSEIIEQCLGCGARVCAMGIPEQPNAIECMRFQCSHLQLQALFDQ